MRAPVAALLAAAATAAAQRLGAGRSPTRDHPREALWYASLRKPDFTPPGPAFAVIWTVLDTLLAYSGYRLLRSRPSRRRTAALAAWGSQLAGVGSFSFVLFGRKRLEAALGVSGSMLAGSAALVGTAASVDRKAALAGLPLLGWLAFATLLQEEVWRRN